MVKRLTIGSLKYNHIIESTVTIDRKIHEKHEEKRKKYKMKKLVEIQQNQQLFQLEVESGQSLLDSALKQNVPIEYKCKKGTCGKCKVKVLKGLTNLERVNSLEEKKLKHFFKSSFRLACQAIGR